MFTGRRLGATPAMLLPPIAMSPPSGAMNPAIMRNSVVLPHPEGPRIEKKLPWATLKDTESTAVCAAKRLTTALATKSALLNWQP